MITQIRIPIVHCTEGIYLRWYYNGFHYYNFRNGYEVVMKTESMDTQILRVFSVISKIERPTKLKSEYSYRVEIEGIPATMIDGFTGLLMAEKVEQYEGSKWYEVDITRDEHNIKEEGAPGYKLSFEITRKELPNTPAVFQKTQLLYIGDTLADLDDSEVIPINKQVNDIAEMQDRQSDFTSGFKVRKTRAMKALFELSGEVGANTTFPYEKQNIRLVQEGIEIISVGYMILDMVDDQYYHVSVYSGNLNFFKEIEGKKLTDLTLASCNHTWNIATQKASHDTPANYIYPLCEPSNDGSITPLTDDGNAVELFGGWVWPFIKLKAIWDEIISATGYTCTGDILTNDTFLKLFMPIASRELANTYLGQYFYVLTNNEHKTYSDALNVLPGGSVMLGDANFADGIYYTHVEGKHKFQVVLITSIYASSPAAYVRDGATDTALTAIRTETFVFTKTITYEGEYDALSGVDLVFVVSPCLLYFYSIMITNIIPVAIGYNSVVTPSIHLPNMSQTDFIKMVCNIFGLIPDVTPRNKTINFWNYSELYDNINIARDWSAYLSEREDETEFKFGDYAQNNYLKYKDSDDVIKDNGRGVMQVDDTTLPVKKDVVELPVSTCDEVTILTDINVSRIAFNEFQPDDSTYEQQKSIDPRIVYVSQLANTKTLTFRDAASPANTVDVVAPFKASSIEVAMSTQITNYSGLSRMLTKTNLRRAKFNLPVYEVAGFKYNIPIYLSQYKAYFYVNKIENYVPGKLTVVPLIKL